MTEPTRIVIEIPFVGDDAMEARLALIGYDGATERFSKNIFAAIEDMLKWFSTGECSDNLARLLVKLMSDKHTVDKLKMAAMADMLSTLAELMADEHDPPAKNQPEDVEVPDEFKDFFDKLGGGGNE